MNTVVLVLMLLTAFNFLLKQTFWKVIAVCVIAAICAAFAGLMWPYAIEQSKTQIANWLSNQPLMLDTAVLLSVEVSVQMAYAMLADVPLSPLVSWIIDFPGSIQRVNIPDIRLSGHFLSDNSLELCRFYPDSNSFRQIFIALFVTGEGITPRIVLPH
mgnify:CR=1 FL=1